MMLEGHSFANFSVTSVAAALAYFRRAKPYKYMKAALAGSATIRDCDERARNFIAFVDAMGVERSTMIPLAVCWGMHVVARSGDLALTLAMVSFYEAEIRMSLRASALQAVEDDKYLAIRRFLEDKFSRC